MRKSEKHFQLYILFFMLCFAAAVNSPAEVRYVSHSGSNTPPFLTWETAANSIMGAVSVSSFGDTIFAANGLYQEQVQMIPGLTLIGAGMDSCIIKWLGINIATLTMPDSCTLKGFYVIAADALGSMVINVNGEGCVISNNQISAGGWGIRINDGDTRVYGNVFNKIITCAVNIYNSSSIIRKNSIYMIRPFATAQAIGIYAEVFDPNHTSVIDSNYIYNEEGFGYFNSSSSSALVTNNIISASFAIFIANSDSVKMFNNLINAVDYGIDNLFGRYTRIFNNYVYGTAETGISFNTDNVLKNNVVTNVVTALYRVPSGSYPIASYNDIWRTTYLYEGFTGDSTNLTVDPMVVNEDPEQGEPDFHLQKYSPLIDAGDPGVLDKDGSRSDIGLYGGPYGEVYTYNDLAPRPPHNISAFVEDSLVKLNWARNTEADISHYRIYRDTVSSFIYDSTKIIGETADTVFFDGLFPFNGEKDFYYLVSAFDNQGNESQPGEEVSVQVTELREPQPAAAESYRLYSNYPNPFNPSTIIPYRLKEAGYVKLYVYDIKGELVKVLVNQWQNEGYHEVVFRPSQSERSRASGLNVPAGPSLTDIASGVYLYQIMVKDTRDVPVFMDIGKMILLK